MKRIICVGQRRVWVLLFLITLLGFCLRSYQLSTIPYGSLVDESHFGYLAYSLLQTGRDEHGQAWPLVFKGFGDYKLPIYAYALLPSVALFDLSVVAIRTPSLLAGTFSILLTFWLVLGFLPDRKGWALLGALIMAISPWPFLLSRFGFESNLALTWWLLALNGLVRLSRDWRWGLLAVIAAATTWYTYIAYRPVTLAIVIFVMGWLVVKRQLQPSRAGLLTGIFALLIAPMMIWGGQTNTARATQIGLLADPGLVMRIDEQRTFCTQKLPRTWCYFTFNKLTSLSASLASRWLATLSPPYLFTEGETSERYLRLSGYGQFSIALLPLFVIGIFSLLTRRMSLSGWKRSLLLLGLLLSALPAIFAGEPQKVRLSPLLPFIVMVMVYGGLLSWEWLEQFLTRFSSHLSRLIKVGVIGLFFSIWFLSSAFFFTSFFVVEMAKESISYQSPVRRLMEYLAPRYHAGERIVFSPLFSDPLMHLAFHAKIDPQVYQETAVLGELEPSGFQHTVGIKGARVTEFNVLDLVCEAWRNKQPTLIVTSSTAEIPFKPVYAAPSDNGVHRLYYVFDALLYQEWSAKACPEREKLK